MEDGFKDPHTGLLYNKFNASHEDELDKLEGELLPFRMVQTLTGQLPPPYYDARGLRAIHHHIFQDIYGWAGELRGWGRYQAIKDSPATGHLQWMYFGSYVQLSEHLDILDQQLAAENYLRGLAPSQFIARFAYYFDQYNYAHSFREGNGRTLAVAFWLLAEQAGFDVNLVAPTGTLRYNHARDYAIYGPMATLNRILNRCGIFLA
jgi:cell filamentation protein